MYFYTKVYNYRNDLNFYRLIARYYEETLMLCIIYTGLPSPRNFRHILHNFDVSFSWENPILPSSIHLTSYIISYNVTDAFNQEFNAFILLSGEANNYVFNKTCSYETGVSLCPASNYCFKLRGAYRKNRTAVQTIPTNKICFNTPKYRKC